ncbi:hypothetical protein K439DRAFT_1618637 [Ramaria rubella]|nr:hypothetical protein K439DRAFT_1618637 [Ramaria rubella]
MSGDPFSSPTNRVAASFRAKRDATSAQLQDSETAARVRQKAQAFSSQMEKAALERRLLAAESEKKEYEIRLTQKERLVAKLESDRRWLADREKEEREEKEQERKEREEEKTTQKQTTAALRNLRIELSTLRDEHAELQESHSTHVRTSAQTINSQKSHLLELTRQAATLEEELTSVKQLAEEHKSNAQELREQLEELALEKGDSSHRSAEDEGWHVVREELHRQAAYMRTLESQNAKLTGELLSLKERHTSVEVLKEEKRDLERKLRAADDLREMVARLEAEVEAGRLEREHWADAQNSSNPRHAPSMNTSQDLAELRLKNALLQEEQGAIKATLHRRDLELKDAVTGATEARECIAKLEEEAKELRHHGARRDRRLDLAEREVGFLNALVASFTAEQHSDSDQDVKLQRIQNLEEMLKTLKSENEQLEQEIIAVGSGKRSGARQASPEHMNNVNLTMIFTVEVTEAQTANAKAADKIEELEQTLFELRGDIASGEHVPPNVRVLSMRDNPLQNWTDMRQEVVDRLNKENDALLKRLEALETSGARTDQGSDEHLVPRESWEKEHKEKCDLEEMLKQKEKRLLRLQQVYSSKAQEFRDTMSSILGFKVHFFANGQVKVTSQYDLNTSFVFQPTGKKQDDDDGTKMQLLRGGDSSLPDLSRTVDYWVNQRMCIPGLMATVTLECYDKTKRGQSQAWTVST